MLNPSDKSNQWYPCLRRKGLSQGRKQVSLPTPPSLDSLLMQLFNNRPSPSQCFQGALPASLQDVLDNKKMLCSDTGLLFKATFNRDCTFISTGVCSCHTTLQGSTLCQSPTEHRQWQETGHWVMLQGRDAGAQLEMGTQILERPSNRKCAVRIHKPGSAKEELAELTSFS